VLLPKLSKRFRLGMKKIEIVTSHNITVVYNLASVSQRLFASALDLLVVGLYAILVSTLLGGVSWLFYLFVFPILMFYHFLFEVFNNGQSIGKMLLKLKVVTLRGRSPSIVDLFLRWIFRTIDVTLSFGTLAILFIASSTKSQRIGDILAETSVIRLESVQYVDVQTLKEISNNRRDILFPEVTQYTDKDMLLVKDVLQRERQFPNAANRRVMRELAQKIKQDLGIERAGLKPRDFLSQVMSDYIVLTR